MGKHSKVPSSTQWGLWENVALQPMESLTPSVSFDIFMDNYFASFRLLTHLGVTTFEQHECSAKIGYANALSLGTNHWKKKECVQLWQWLVRTTTVQFTYLLLNLVNLRHLFGVRTKLKQIYSRTITKSVSLLQPEHGFCQQNGPERAQVLVSECKKWWWFPLV